MADINQEQVIDYLSGLTVMDLVDLTKKLEEKWDVKAAPVAVAAGPAAGPAEDAKELVESAPKEVKADVSKAEAEEIAGKLKDAGAEVELK